MFNLTWIVSLSIMTFVLFGWVLRVFFEIVWDVLGLWNLSQPRDNQIQEGGKYCIPFHVKTHLCPAYRYTLLVPIAYSLCNRDALGSHVCLGILSYSFLGCPAADTTVHKVPVPSWGLCMASKWNGKMKSMSFPLCSGGEFGLYWSIVSSLQASLHFFFIQATAIFFLNQAPPGPNVVFS